MPLWKIYHTDNNTFAIAEARGAQSKAITAFYTSQTGMPAFCVGVVFLHCLKDALYIGGHVRAARNPFVRFEVDQIHIRHPEGDDAAGLQEELRGVMRDVTAAFGGGGLGDPHRSDGSAAVGYWWDRAAGVAE